MITIDRLAEFIESHGFACNVDAAHLCIQVVIPCTRNGVFSGYIVETVNSLDTARTALGY